jgi:hypothetical protein
MDYLVGCILNGCPIRVLIVRLNDMLIHDTVTVRVDPSATERVVSALLPLQPAMKEICELNPVFRMSTIAIDTTGKYLRIDSSTNGRLSESCFEMKWFIDG